MKIYNWRPFLERWSADWVESIGALGLRDGDEEALRERWLGFPAAGEERIRALEERLGVTLPPTYRSFLATTDGWRPAGTGLSPLGAADGVRRHADPGGRQEISGDGADAVDAVDIWAGALELSPGSDVAGVLLDPGDVNADGEWAAFLHRGRPDENPDRYESFMELMQALFREFHRANQATPGFVNETTRELDADVEEARTACLRGDDIDAQLELLIEADEHGRPRARGLRAQVEAMLDGGPVHSPVVADLGDPLRETDGSTVRYEPPGPFGTAVATAREQARWGDTDAAWHILAPALGDWEPYGAEHIAPVGLLADPVLGPVITPERGRYILETPRGSGRGRTRDRAEEAPEPVVDGLAWLADQEEQQGSYRFVLAQGLSPEDLAGHIGHGPLLPPSSEEETSVLFGQEGRRTARVGLCGGGWSFAFESRTEPFRPEPLSSPGGVSGPDGVSGPLGTVPGAAKSVLVWVERPGQGAASPGTFHFSCAEDGEPRYGFTVRGEETGTEHWGEVPESLDPKRLFPDSGDRALDLDDEYEGLTAVAEEFGVSLPHFAIRYGRLHAVATQPEPEPERQPEPEPGQPS
ncbi:SMI1/KNR4 family protein [Streptomyces sp. NPDC126933]|uniref:SMI1/KNR4 family protein n=1 Tax=unclassified Streptomyces TaxID=2593676 RepID=UPI003654EA55